MFSVSVLNPTFSSLACAPVDYSDDPYSRRVSVNLPVCRVCMCRCDKKYSNTLCIN